MKISLDTNILIDNPKIVFDKNKKFVISFMVLRELDKLKRNPDLKRAAQAAIKNIKIAMKSNDITILNVPTSLGDSPDEKIVQDTKDAGAKLLSGDIGANVIAEAFDVPISDFEAESDIDYDYTGYIIKPVGAEYDKLYKQITEVQLVEFNGTFNVDLQNNQYCIMERIGDKNDIWVNHDGVVTRISQSMKPARDAGMIISPMDDIQMCAIHAIIDNDIPLTVIDGKLGTGKTLLALVGALTSTIGQKRLQHYDRVLVTKPPVSINKDIYTGYKPGTREEKMSGHLGGIKSNLKYLLDRKSNRETAIESQLKETVSDTVWDEKFDIIEIDEIQGTSIHNSIFLVDEFQLLGEETLFLVLSRISEGSKIVLIGDTVNQTYGMNRANEGFKVLFEYFGKANEFSYIRLENIYRSALAEFVSRVFKEE